ncbi:helix-turn-helix transcriptional regulator [Streptomyces sp. NPDC049954]|uniref:helix-turn-helix domain-containing protein n=1 Tax=Streptomyces sp. NPDC049954 TaxID=3155779 RepID=UPI0034303237
MRLDEEFKILTWEYFGEELKRARMAAGLTQSELAARVYVSASYIAQFEIGQRKPQLDVAERIDAVLETGGTFRRMVRKLIHTRQGLADHFLPMHEAEPLATAIYEFQDLRIPGLLQTSAYAYAITRAMYPLAEDVFVNSLVEARMKRARILADTTRPKYWLILHEAALLTPVGGRAAMREQLEYVLSRARRHEVAVQVLPFAAGAPGVMIGPIRLMEFEDTPSVLYTEALSSSAMLDDSHVYRKAQEVYAQLRTAALPLAASMHMLESAAESYQ